MKIRSDSPFASFTEEDKDLLLEMAEGRTFEELAAHTRCLTDLRFSCGRPLGRRTKEWLP